MRGNGCQQTGQVGHGPFGATRNLSVKPKQLPELWHSCTKLQTQGSSFALQACTAASSPTHKGEVTGDAPKDHTACLQFHGVFHCKFARM